MPPRVSVIIPTHNRRASLERTLGALATQDWSGEPIDVVVVADGCSDGTERVAIPAGLGARVITQSPSGPAAARNRGAAAATGDLLLFLDDDVEAWPGLVGAHVRVHLAEPKSVIVIGYLPPKLQDRRDLFGITLRGWWDAMFERMRTPGRRFTYADVLSGNCSIGASLFQSIGGFDEQFRCHEDYELGYRALRAGIGIRFAPNAGGWHDERTDLHRALRRKREEGYADIALARRYPELWPALPCSEERRPTSRRARLLQNMALSRPAAGDVIAGASARALGPLARARARARWRRTLDDLLWYWYWRGVADALGGEPFAEFRDATVALRPPGVLQDIDLQPGLAAAAHRIDQLAPEGVRLRYGSLHVGTIPIQPWAEPLSGRHLRHVLETTHADRLAQALGIAQALAPAADAISASNSEPPAVMEHDGV